MIEHTASRTLVKSAPELWAECSDAGSLARHLGAFGEIRITKLEPETAVAWEGDAARGTVTLEPSGWGTKVVLTATPEAGAQAVKAPEPEPPAGQPETPARPRRPWFARVFPRWSRHDDPAAEPPPSGEEPPAAIEPPEEHSDRAGQALTDALDSLGQAHHRPYSRA